MREPFYGSTNKQRFINSQLNQLATLRDDLDELLFGDRLDG